MAVPARKRVIVFGIVVIAYTVIAALVAVIVNWPSQFGYVGTSARADVLVSGTAVSAPLLPIALLVVSLLLVRAGGRWTMAGLAGYSAVALLFIIGGLGEAFAAGTPDTPKVVLVVSGVVAVAIALAMLAFAFAAFQEKRRATRTEV